MGTFSGEISERAPGHGAPSAGARGGDGQTTEEHGERGCRPRFDGAGTVMATDTRTRSSSLAPKILRTHSGLLDVGVWFSRSGR